MLSELRVANQEVVFAQAKIESGNFSSDIWRENNNPFGMKLARSRPTTAIGENRGHAVYKTWQDAVFDYCLWQLYSGFRKNKLTTEEYISELLRLGYAEDVDYAKKLKGIVKNS